jgi:hypothetical protein
MHKIFDIPINSFQFFIFLAPAFPVKLSQIIKAISLKILRLNFDALFGKTGKFPCGLTPVHVSPSYDPETKLYSNEI